jgi:hypothetical protein
MSAGRAAIAALLCAAFALPAFAGEGLAAACPGAESWNKAHPDDSEEARSRRDAARSFTDPALRMALAARVARDQAARNALPVDMSSRQARQAVLAVDEDNVKWLYGLVTSKGLPTMAQVGEQGVLDAWLLAQHADRAPKFQAALLPAFEQRHAAGEFNASDLARFTDRILKAQGKPQRYGTQFPPEEMRRKYFGLPDETSVREVDAHRRELGIMPLADYACMMSFYRLGPR